MSALNRPVDVLGWIRNTPADNGWKAKERDAVANAVAELIVEAKRAEYMLRDMAEAGFGDPRQADGLRITLARIGGAK